MTLLFSTDDHEYYFLSNFYPYPLKSSTKKWKPLPILYDGTTWPTSEHLYQALKFRNETDDEKQWREIIRTSNTPTIAKYLGHQFTIRRYSWQKKYFELVQHYQPLVRHAINLNNKEDKARIMLETCRAKFKSCPDLAAKLKATGDLALAENTTDDWGIGGANLLGKVLMQVRSEL